MKLHPYENKLLEISNKNDDVIVCTAETRFAMRGIAKIMEDKLSCFSITPVKAISAVVDVNKIDEYFVSISGQYILIDDYNISSNPNLKEYMEYRYFESPFDKFSQVPEEIRS